MKFTILLHFALFYVINSAAFTPGRCVEKRGSALHMGLLGRFRNKRQVEIPNPISIGSRLPEVDIQVVADGEGTPMSIQEALGDGTSVLVGMPGAFTPTCSGVHLPGYLEAAPKLKRLGVDNIAFVTTNDKWVNDAWGKSVGIVEEKESPFTMISDGDGDLVRELGLADDMGFGVGVRSKRFAMVVNDGKATHVEIDEGMDDCESSSAQNIINVLTPEDAKGEVEIDQKTLGAVAGALVLGAFLLSAKGNGGGTSSSTNFQMLNDMMLAL